MTPRTPDQPGLSRNRFILGLALIVLVAGGVRLGMASAFVGLSSPPDLSASPDQAEYDAILQQLIAGNGYAKHDGTPTARRAPGMVFTLLAGYAVSGGSYAVTRITLIALSAATCLLIGLTVGRVFSRRAGLIAAGLLALLPGHAYYAMHLLSEAPFGFWLALALWLSVIAMQAQRRRQVWFAVAGLCWGMAVLTKPQFILLAPLAVLASASYALRHRSWQPALAAAVCVATASAVVMPWYARNASVLDAPGLSTIGGYGLWAGNNELVLDDPAWRGRAMPTSRVEAELGVKLPEGEAASDAQAKAYARAFIAEHKADMPILAAWKVYRLATPFQATPNRAAYWALALSWIAIAPLLFAGIVIAMRNRPKETLMLLGPLVVTLGVTLVYFAIIRYRHTLLPVIVAFAAVAIDSAWRRIASRHTGQPAGTIGPASEHQPRAQAA